MTLVGRGLAPAELSELTSMGKIVEEQLLDLPNRFPCIVIDKYVIMPNHVHVIFIILPISAGASPRPTIMDVVCAFKSLSTRLCNKDEGITGRKIWQDSFHEHIIRNEQAYQKICKYIDENPVKWEEDRYFAAENEGEVVE